MSFAEFLEKNNPFPFRNHGSTRMLRNKDFDRIEGNVAGVGTYQKFTWDKQRGNFIVEGDIVGQAINIHLDNVILSECENSYIVVLRDTSDRLEYQKTDFTLIKNSILSIVEPRQKFYL